MTDEELIQRLSLLVLDVRELVAERDQLRARDKEAVNLTIDQQAEIGRLAIENKRLRAALRQILDDDEARILDSHRDDGWQALLTP